jgi:hypothetical protein
MWFAGLLAATLGVLGGDQQAYFFALKAEAARLHLAEDRYWQLLLHMQPDLLGAKSRVDAPSFFLAPDGSTNPAAELEATLAALLSPPNPQKPDEHPQCRFVARYVWLAQQLRIDPNRLQPQPCPELGKWLQVMAPGSASLIFVASYLNAPASMYGHTLLRLERKDSPGIDLLANIVNYAAQPWTFNPVLYSALGLMGGFDGHFAAMPYYRCRSTRTSRPATCGNIASASPRPNSPPCCCICGNSTTRVLTTTS